MTWSHTATGSAELLVYQIGNSPVEVVVLNADDDSLYRYCACGEPLWPADIRCPGCGNSVTAPDDDD
jgi:hypothetical protein